MNHERNPFTDPEVGDRFYNPENESTRVVIRLAPMVANPLSRVIHYTTTSKLGLTSKRQCYIRAWEEWSKRYPIQILPRTDHGQT